MRLDEMLQSARARGAQTFHRLPGLYRRWEMPQVIESGRDFRFEEAGKATDGTQLFAIYRRERSIEERTND